MQLTKGLYPFWDDELIQTQFTDATLSVNRPDRAENVFKTDAPWEGNNCDFFSTLRDGGLYRMYYTAFDLPSTHPFFICYAESLDGIRWEKPSLQQIEFNGSRDNNIILSDCACAYVLKDPNPACTEDERYKLFADRYGTDAGGGFRVDLVMYASGDGIHFTEHHVCRTPTRYPNMFDSLNTVWWDENDGLYYCFFRTTHPRPSAPNDRFEEKGVRAVMVMTSEDCVDWSEGTPLDYGGGEDYQLYCNCISPYPYDKRYWIGFPTRYNERLEWNDSFEQLGGKDWRKSRMEWGEKRYGLTVTDCVFMSSRDKYRWHRFDEACLVPGPEDGINWEYGDCYAAVGLIETPGRFSSEPELALLCESHHWTDRPVELIRYLYRKDGFASYKASSKPKTVMTKPFTFSADSLHVNFRTSARGFIKIMLLDECANPIDGYVSCEHFGDTTDRLIRFDKPLADLSGQTVRMKIVMSDAELFSFSLL